MTRVNFTFFIKNISCGLSLKVIPVGTLTVEFHVQVILICAFMIYFSAKIIIKKEEKHYPVFMIYHMFWGQK